MSHLCTLFSSGHSDDGSEVMMLEPLVKQQWAGVLEECVMGHKPGRKACSSVALSSEENPGFGRFLKPSISSADGENQRVVAVALAGPWGPCSGCSWTGHVTLQGCTIEGSHIGGTSPSKPSAQLSLLACLHMLDSLCPWSAGLCDCWSLIVFCSCICRQPHFISTERNAKLINKEQQCSVTKVKFCEDRHIVPCRFQSQLNFVAFVLTCCWVSSALNIPRDVFRICHLLEYFLPYNLLVSYLENVIGLNFSVV